MVDCLKESHLVITDGPFCVLGGEQVRVDFVTYLQRCLVQKGTCHFSMVGKQMGETRSVLRDCLRSKNNLANQGYKQTARTDERIRKGCTQPTAVKARDGSWTCRAELERDG